jgi:hypothetical protein
VKAQIGDKPLKSALGEEVKANDSNKS